MKPPCELIANDASEKCRRGHDSEEKKKRPPETGNWVGRRAIRLGDQSEDSTQRSTDAVP